MKMKKIISSLLACVIAVGAILIPSANSITAEAASSKLNLKVTYTGSTIDFDWDEVDNANFYVVELVSDVWTNGAAVTINGSTSQATFTENGLYMIKKVSDSKYPVYLDGIPSNQKSLKAVIYAFLNDGSVISDEEKIADYTKLEKTDFVSQSTAVPENVKAVGENNAIKVTWDKMEGASGYRICISDAGKDFYSEVGISKTNSYTIKDLDNNKKYDIMVMEKNSSFCTIVNNVSPKIASKDNKTSSKSEKASSTKLSAPAGFKVTKGTTKIQIKWNAVEGADAYRVYKYNPETKKYEKYKTVSGASCTIKDLEANTKYKFKVVALDKQNKKYVSGKTSKTVTVSTKAK